MTVVASVYVCLWLPEFPSGVNIGMGECVYVASSGNFSISVQACIV